MYIGLTSSVVPPLSTTLPARNPPSGPSTASTMPRTRREAPGGTGVSSMPRLDGLVIAYGSPARRLVMQLVVHGDSSSCAWTAADELPWVRRVWMKGLMMSMGIGKTTVEF